jgi:hypothetical protein
MVGSYILIYYLGEAYLFYLGEAGLVYLLRSKLVSTSIL